MKKILFAIAIVLTIGITATAQNTDGFFTNWNAGDYDNRTNNPLLPATPTGEYGGLSGDVEAPIGSGLLILTALGIGYAVSRKQE